MGAGYDKLVGELVMVQNTGSRRVGLLAGAHADFTALDDRWLKKLTKHFENYGVPGTTLPKEHFNSEGRHSSGGPRAKQIQICAFKAFQHRVYGMVTNVRGIETFVGIKVVDDKKTQKADQAMLVRLAKSLGEYLD